MPDFDCRSAAKSGFLLCEWKIVHQIAGYSILPMDITVYTITNITPPAARTEKDCSIYSEGYDTCYAASALGYI